MPSTNLMKYGVRRSRAVVHHNNGSGMPVCGSGANLPSRPGQPSDFETVDHEVTCKRCLSSMPATTNKTGETDSYPQGVRIPQERIERNAEVIARKMLGVDQTDSGRDVHAFPMGMVTPGPHINPDVSPYSAVVADVGDKLDTAASLAAAIRANNSQLATGLADTAAGLADVRKKITPAVYTLRGPTIASSMSDVATTFLSLAEGDQPSRDELVAARDYLNYEITRMEKAHVPAPTSGTRAALPGERCTCGRQAVEVFVHANRETGYCGLPDGGAKTGPCPFCGGQRHETGRCPQYTLSPVTEV